MTPQLALLPLAAATAPTLRVAPSLNKNSPRARGYLHRRSARNERNRCGGQWAMAPLALAATRD